MNWVNGKGLVYVAGPYAAAGLDERLRNVERASQLGLHAVQAGLSPIVVHPAIAAGAYGRDDVAEERERGLGAVLELVRVVALCGGALWVIERDQGGLSEGTAHELELYLAQGGQSVKRAGWPIWRAVIGGGAE